MPVKRQVLLGGQGERSLQIVSSPQMESNIDIAFPTIDALEVSLGHVDTVARENPRQFVKAVAIDGLLKTVQGVYEVERADDIAQAWWYRLHSMSQASQKNAIPKRIADVRITLSRALEHEGVSLMQKHAAERGMYEIDMSQVRTVKELGWLATRYDNPLLFQDTTSIIGRVIDQEEPLPIMFEESPILVRNAVGAISQLRPKGGRTAKSMEFLQKLDQLRNGAQHQLVTDLGARIVRMRSTGESEYPEQAPRLSYEKAVEVILNFAAGDYLEEHDIAKIHTIDQIKRVVMHTARP